MFLNKTCKVGTIYRHLPHAFFRIDLVLFYVVGAIPEDDIISQEAECILVAHCYTVIFIQNMMIDVNIPSFYRQRLWLYRLPVSMKFLYNNCVLSHIFSSKLIYPLLKLRHKTSDLSDQGTLSPRPFMVKIYSVCFLIFVYRILRLN